jgi:hypothetical protein
MFILARDTNSTPRMPTRQQYKNIRRNLWKKHTHWHTSTGIGKRGTPMKEEKGNNVYF